MLRGIPNSVKEYLLGLKQGDKAMAAHAAMVLDALYLVGYDGGDEITIASVLRTFAMEDISMKYHSLKKGLRQLVALGLVACRKYNDKRRGAPVTIYRLISVNMLVEKLGCFFGACDALTHEAFANLATYCAYVHHEFLRRCPGEKTRKWLGERLGKSARSTYNYEQRFVDVEVKANFKVTEITWDNIGDIPLNRESGPVFLRTYIQVPLTEAEIEEENADIGILWRFNFARRTHRLVEKRYPSVRAVAVKLLQAGQRVERVEQMANSYRILSPLEVLLRQSNPA